MDKTCQECGAKCCRYFCLEIDKPETFEDYEDIRWFVLHRNVAVHIEENGDWYLQVNNRCRNLRRDNLCRDYENRPIICRKYSPDDCDHTGADYRYRAEFTNPEQVEAYARKKLGNKAYEKARAKAIAKIERKQDKRKKRKRRK